ADVREFALSPDGSALVYSVGATRDQVIAAEQAEYDRGIRIDERVPIGQPLYRSASVQGRRATQRYTGVGFDRAALLADKPDRWKVVDLKHGVRRNAKPSELPPGLLSAADLGDGLSEPWKLSSDRSSGRIALLTRVGDGAGLLYKP